MWLFRSQHLRSVDLFVKVIKQVSAKEYLVADATGFHKIQIERFLLDKNKKKLHKNNYVKIKNAKVDLRSMLILLDIETKIYDVYEFPVDETNPAKFTIVCISIAFFP